MSDSYKGVRHRFLLGGAPVTEMIAVVMGRESVLPRHEDIPDRGGGRKFTLP